jgi:hypothetical protein
VGGLICNLTLQPLKGFQTLRTHHCVTGSVRHIYEFHKYPISEDLLLGLGAGVGFIYWHMKGTAPFFGGRANVGRPGEEGLQKTAGRRTGVRIEPHHTLSARKAEAAVLDLLGAGEPVMVQLDMGFLPYFDFPKEYHFGGHVVVLAGHDPETRQVLVADRDGELHPVSLETLARARGSGFKPFPPRNTWYTFDFSHKRPPTEREVRQAIREVTTGMLKPPITNLGVRGIRTAAERIVNWPRIMSKDDLRYACFNVFVFIDAKGGSGGGIFRYMYGRFLKEAAAITDDERLSNMGQEIHSIADQWQQVAQTFEEAHSRTDPSGLFCEASRLILDIADREQTTWQQLHHIVGGSGRDKRSMNS